MERVKRILRNWLLEKKARKRALFISPNTTLKPVWIKNPGRTPSGVGKIAQQKRHSIRSALKNGGAENFDGVRVLRPRSAVSLFIRQLTGKKQAFENFTRWILRHCENFISLLRNICQKHSKFPTQSNREISGKEQRIIV